MDLKERIKVHKELISERLDPDFGLLDVMLSSRSLTRPEIAEVKAVSHSYGKSEKLMEYIFDKGIYDKFLEALRSTEQTHLVNFILGNGEHCTEFGDDWPLTEQEISIIDTNQQSLVDLLDTCDLLSRLYSMKVINNRQRDFVLSKPAPYEKNDALLEIMRRSSLRNYRKMIQCLHASKQSRVADIFKEGGVVVRTHADLETTTNVNEVEDELITKFIEILRDRSLEDSTRILEYTQLCLIAAKKGQSILLYFFCKTSAELFNLREMQVSGKLANVVRKTFNEMLSRAQVTNVTIRFSNEDFINCEKFFQSVGVKDQDKMDENLDNGDEESLTSKTPVPRLMEEAKQGQKSEERLREITECAICMSTFKDPRMLPCIHTFCLKCLKCTGDAEQKKPKEKMPCPICRKEFIIPNSGMIGLQKNFFMENLNEFKNLVQIGSTSVSCDMCIVRNEGITQNISTATMRCLECRGNYCDSCSKVHKKSKFSVHHHIVKLGEETKEEYKRMISVSTCTRHIQKPLDFYCADCKKIVCVSCFDESHKLHDCKNVATVDEEFRQTIGKHSFKTSAYANEMLSMRKNTEVRKADFLKEISKMEKEILKRNQELKNIVDEHSKSLFDELTRIKSNHLKEIENEMEEIERSWTMLRSFEAYCTELSSKGSARDICSSVDELLVRADELEKDSVALIGSPHQSIEVSFKETDIREVFQKSNKNIVGQMKVKREANAQLEDFVLIVGLEDSTTRITKNIIQINLHRPNEISTHQQIPTTMQREATAAVYRNTLYVAGIGGIANEIWKYSVASGWKKCDLLVQGRRRHSAAFIDEVMYICGGFVDSDGRVLDSVEAYNAITNKCSTVGKLFYCVQSSGNCVPIKTSLYIFGGCDKDNNAMKHVQVYDTKLNTCTLLSKPMPIAYNLMQAALSKTSVILVGWDNCFIFNFETETWQVRKQFKADVGHFGLVLENERLFVFGGGIQRNDILAKTKWKCRDDVRCVPLRNIMEDKPVEWKIHAKLPQPSPISAYGKLTLSRSSKATVFLTYV